MLNPQICLKSIPFTLDPDKCQSFLNLFSDNWNEKKKPWIFSKSRLLFLRFFGTVKVLRFNEVIVLTLLIKMWICN